MGGGGGLLKKESPLSRLFGQDSTNNKYSNYRMSISTTLQAQKLAS